jgi:CrcB protein
VTLLLISLGAFVGAPARYLTDRRLQARYGGDLPLGTLTVNLVACLVLGGVLGAGSQLDSRLVGLIGTGFCGALSTYSTFSYETMRLQQIGRPRVALAYVALSLICGLGLAAAGWALGSALS